MSAHIGDFLITFHSAEPSLPTRGQQPWQLAQQIGPAAIWTTEPDTYWRGFPMQAHADDQWQLWILGEFYGSQPSFPQALANPSQLNGHFLIVAYEKSARRWHIINNAFGSMHAYYAAQGERAAMGSFSPAVARAAGIQHLDWDAIGTFFKFGFFLGQHSYWQGLQLFQPGTHSLLDADGQLIQSASFSAWDYTPNNNLSYAQALGDFRDLFHEVLADQTSGKRVALPLSGGLDSRSTLAELIPAGQPAPADFFAYSYGYTDDSAETKIAKQLARNRALPLTCYTVKPYLFAHLNRISACLEGFQDITQARQAFVVDALALQSDYVLAAHWGDVWLDDMGFLDKLNLTTEQLSAQIFRKIAKKGSDTLTSLFRDWLPATLETDMQAQIGTQLDQLAHIEHTDFKVKLWKTQNWSWRWTLPSLRMFQAGVFPLLPFYDQRLVRFFCLLPAEWVRQRQFQIDYLKRFAPDLARVNWQPYNANLYTYQGFNSWLLPRRALTKLSRSLFPRPIIQRNWELQFLNPQGKAGLREHLLSAGLKLHDFVPRQRLEETLTSFYAAPNASNGYTISMLLTFSAWLEQYG